MTQALANPGRFKWCNDALCKAQLRFEALWTLSQAGHRRTDFLSDIVAQSSSFDSATQIRLARYLLKTPGWQGQGAAMADRLQQTLYVTGRYSVANLASAWSWLGSLVDAQSQMLQLLIERRAPAEQIDGAVRALVAQQCKCGWPTTDDTASALTALSAYAATEQLTPSTATAMVGDRTVVSVKFGQNGVITDDYRRCLVVERQSRRDRRERALHAALYVSGRRPTRRASWPRFALSGRSTSRASGARRRARPLWRRWIYRRQRPLRLPPGASSTSAFERSSIIRWTGS